MWVKLVYAEWWAVRFIRQHTAAAALSQHWKAVPLLLGGTVGGAVSFEAAIRGKAPRSLGWRQAGVKCGMVALMLLLLGVEGLRHLRAFR